MQKLKLHSPDFTQENITKLAVMFPNCVTETREADGTLKKAIDFDQLRQELSPSLVEGPQERYQLNWPGKREALLTANAPIAKTLRPCREESVDFDTTQNLFIEGDNLDALKLLQSTYLGKVKMIYIDPPYNTGKEFIYDDDFSEDTASYFQRSNQKDEVGNRMVANTETNGRFHSDWLSMMYTRLKLARNLLRDDGVIFISIDDNEQANLKRLCDEVFGENNFISNVIWEKKFAPQNDDKYITATHDYILIYAREKNSLVTNLLPRSESALKKFKNPDNDPRGVWTSGDLTSKTKAAGHSYPVVSPSGATYYPPAGRQWAPSLDTFNKWLNESRIWFGENGENVPRIKQFLSEIQDGVVPMSIWKHEDVGHNQSATQELKKIFDGFSFFDSPKPNTLLQRVLYLTTANNDIILDFFSGSATTAHAVMQLNAEDGGKRKFIMVQLPEACDERSEAYKAGYPTIAEIGKERIRRAGKKILKEMGCGLLEENSVGEALASTGPALQIEAKASPTNTPLTKTTIPDIGFRVLKIDSSNMRDVYYTPDAVQQTHLFDQVDNIREDRTAEDLLFQVLLDWGVDLTLPITQETIAGKSVLLADDNALAACFDTDINEAFVKELAARHPMRVVFRDAGFVSDSVKINIEQIFKLISPTTEIKTL